MLRRIRGNLAGEDAGYPDLRRPPGRSPRDDTAAPEPASRGAANGRAPEPAAAG